MTAGYDDFLSELRTQLVQSAQSAAREARPAPGRRAAWLTMPRPAFVAAAAVLVAAVAAVAIVPLLATMGGSHSTPAELPPSAPGPQRPPAYVLPLVTGTSPSPGSTTPTDVASSYSLWALAARSETDIWAVGARGGHDGPEGAQSGSFILHWDGAEWREAPAPDVGPLRAVATTAAGEAWALGDDAGAILRWDGRQWTAAARGVPYGCALNGLAVVGGRETWAVGSLDGEPLAMRWDGFSWRAAELPALPVDGGLLTGVSGSSPTDVWAVGASADGAQGLVLHYDGAGWTTYASRDAWGALGAVGALSPTDVWVGGARLWHWDGVSWTGAAEDSPGVTAGPMSALSPTDIWLPGEDGRSVVHWDGETWRSIGADEMGLPAEADCSLQGVTALPGGDVWVAGTRGRTDAGGQRPLIVRGDETGWHVAVDIVQTSGEE